MESIDPYRTPAADISPALDGAVTFSSPYPDAGRLRLGAWLIILSLLLMVISLTLSLMLDAQQYSGLIKWGGAAADTLCALASIITLMIWRGWLHARFDFHDVDKLITLYIAVTLLATFAAIPLEHNNSAAFLVVTFGGVFLLGVSGLILALRLKPLVERYPYMKTYRVLFIIESALLASVVLLVLAIPLIFASEICRALMMLHAARERETFDAGV